MILQMGQTVLLILISISLVHLVVCENSLQKDSITTNVIDTDYVYRVGKEAMKLDSASDELHNMFQIEEIMQCYKKHGLDPGNLPDVEEISKSSKTTIFNSCNPFFNVPIIALKRNDLNQPLFSRQQNRAKHQEKRSLSRSHDTETKKMTKDTGSTTVQPSDSAKIPIEVLISFNGIDIVNEILRLHFLFLNTFFSSLSGCIESEVVELSMCLLDSLSTAFSVLAIELGDF